MPHADRLCVASLAIASSSCGGRVNSVIVRAPRPQLPTMPLQFSDEEITVLRQLAEPLDQKQRSAFLVAVAAEREAGGRAGAVGIGFVHRDGRVVQRKFFDPPQLPNTSPRARA
jgi:hypothetical protein